MAKIFINYRREDSSPYVGRLVDHLELLFKDGEVFRDIKSIVPGEDFKKAIDEAIQSFDYILVIIGPTWLSALKKRSTKDAKDFVRLELAAALHQGKKVIPVIVGGASMPAKKDLPKDIAALHKLHGLELTDSHFKSDVQKLVETMGGSLGTFRMFFEVPFTWSFKNEIYLFVALKGPQDVRFWNVVPSGTIGVAVRPTVSPQMQQQRPWLQHQNAVRKPDQSPSFLELKLKSGHYKLSMTLKRREGKYLGLVGTFYEQFKSATFDLLNEENVAFKGILKSEHDVTQRLTYTLELELM